MGVDHVDAEVLYTDVSAGAAFYSIPGDGSLQAFRAFNSAAIDFASQNPKRLLPVYLIPIADVDEAVAEVQRVAADGARALHLPPRRSRLRTVLGRGVRPTVERGG